MTPSQDPGEPHRLPVRRQALIVAALAAAAAAVLAAVSCVGSVSSGGASATPATAMAADVQLTPAQLASLSFEPVRVLEFRTERAAEGAIGLDADAATAVFSPLSGRVARVLVGLGERVQAGERLLAVEAPELVQGESDLYNAASQLKLAGINERRKHAAYEAKGGSLQDWQQSQADLAGAETALAAARDRLRILGKTAREIAAMERTRTNDPIAYVLAPIGGIVTDRQVGPGQYLQSGSSTAVYTIGDLSKVWLVANVRENDAPLIERGQQIEVHVPALPGQQLEATVTAIGATVDPVTHRVPVRATLVNPGGKLKPGMFAGFDIITSEATSAPAVPEEAVVREGDEARVWVLEGARTVGLRHIRTGRTNDGMVEVLAGLSAGERVVTRGSLFIDRAAQPG
jgi:cobalt-zinc-cadmium efflux system membrane fusion protein